MSESIYIKAQLMKCPMNEIHDFLDNYSAQRINWKLYINNLLNTKSYSYNKLSERIGVSKNTVRKWCEEGVLPQNRDFFVKIAFAADMSVEEANEMLKVYGNYAELYPRDVNDAIIMFILKMHKQYPDNESYSYNSIKDWKKKYLNWTRNKKSPLLEKKSDNQTIYVKAELNKINEEIEFEKFLSSNQQMFLSSHSKLIEYIEDYISVREYELEGGEIKISIHRLLSEYRNGAKLEQAWSRLKNYGILPERKQLISLGIMLNMTIFEINKMLSLAYMRELYVRDKFDCVVMCVLNNAVKADPGFEIESLYDFCAASKNKEWRKECKKAISQLELETDMGDDISEVYIEKLSEYVIEKLSEISENLAEANDLIDILS